jgi:hypothetical protein
MTKIMRIGNLLPETTHKQRRDSRELTEWHQYYIDSIFEYSGHSLADYLGDSQAGGLDRFYSGLDKIGVGLAPPFHTD